MFPRLDSNEQKKCIHEITKIAEQDNNKSMQKGEKLKKDHSKQKERRERRLGINSNNTESESRTCYFNDAPHDISFLCDSHENHALNLISITSMSSI